MDKLNSLSLECCKLSVVFLTEWTHKIKMLVGAFLWIVGECYVQNLEEKCLFLMCVCFCLVIHKNSAHIGVPAQHIAR